MNKLLLIKLKKAASILIIASLTLLTSCKSSQIKNTNSSVNNSSITELINLHNTKDFNFSTLQSRLRITYDNGEKAVSPSANLRLEKDKQIWISIKFLGITMAKAYITPERVSFYEKLNKRYYDGDFTALSNFLGTEVNFNKVQNLLLGQSIIEFKNQKYITDTSLDNQVLITPKKQDPLYNILLGLYKNSYKVSQLKISQAANSNSIKVDYPEYQTVFNQDFPKNINIVAKNNEGSNTMNIDYKSVETNVNVTFPYTVPKGYSLFTLN